jgi:hypothetical protein
MRFEATWRGLTRSAFTLSLAEGYSDREREAVQYLSVAFDRWAEVTGEERRLYTELAARTLRDLAGAAPQDDVTDLVDRLLETCCDRSTWLTDRQQAYRWMAQHLGQLLSKASPDTVAGLCVSPSVSPQAMAGYVDALQEAGIPDHDWINPFARVLDARLANPGVTLDPERLGAVSRLIRTEGTLLDRPHLQRVLRVYLLGHPIRELRDSRNLPDLIDLLACSQDERPVIAALVDLVPRHWSGKRVKSLV